MKRRDFVKTCAFGLCGSAIACCGLSSLNKKPSADIEEKTIESIEMHIVEHCNLSCKYCLHFSNIAEPSYYDINKYEKDISALSNALKGGTLKVFKILGGEPLLHPQINTITEITRKYLKNSEISIVTNALKLDSMDESFWKTLAENNIDIYPSFYPNLSINWNSIIKKAHKYNVILLDENRKKIKSTKSIKYKDFCKLYLDLDGKQTTHKPDCMFKTVGVNYVNGKLYRCFLPSNIIHFNKRFGKNLKVDKDDYIDIYKTNNIDEILSKFEEWNNKYPFCRYCKHFSFFDIKWRNAKTHDISEWT